MPKVRSDTLRIRTDPMHSSCSIGYAFGLADVPKLEPHSLEFKVSTNVDFDILAMAHELGTRILAKALEMTRIHHDGPCNHDDVLY